MQSTVGEMSPAVLSSYEFYVLHYEHARNDMPAVTIKAQLLHVQSN